MTKLLKVSSLVLIVFGVVMIIGGVYGFHYISKQVSQEKIITPADSSIPGELVKGPFTLKAQAEIIRYHTLKMTGGKTYAEMPREIEKKDDNGDSIMVPNTNRDIWITATALISALNLGILSYAFSGLVLILGIIFILIGIIFCKLVKNPFTKKSLETL